MIRKDIVYLLVCQFKDERFYKIHDWDYEYNKLTNAAAKIRALNQKNIKSVQVWHVETWHNYKEVIKKLGNNEDMEVYNRQTKWITVDTTKI